MAFRRPFALVLFMVFTWKFLFVFQPFICYNLILKGFLSCIKLFPDFNQYKYDKKQRFSKNGISEAICLSIIHGFHLEIFVRFQRFLCFILTLKGLLSCIKLFAEFDQYKYDQEQRFSNNGHFGGHWSQYYSFRIFQHKKNQEQTFSKIYPKFQKSSYLICIIHV